ncbi:hypothetical protein [Actinoplanes derwentensis]|uniref:tRNA_anti-like n=1 Tax=Actinoplanes derwentensis TaxID=113562 RepID=A0A1H2CBB4_9ACTN|nr:hypothetical protein [Actinoplanes derwentensis]GID88178.1 hypothetical protein Ade03nite_71020 [Actinoplanes derwentensis]SDT67731.1 hypothetical protein SAMN04489716_5516 [Actinoplanes derwentensis]
MQIRKAVVPAALLLALIAGCANNAPIDAGGAPEPAFSTSGTTAEPSTAPYSASASASPEPGSVTLTGTVSAGVEAKCLLLKDGTGDHLLIIRDDKLRASIQDGARVTVVGKAQSGLMTTCMQGQPFVVSSVTVH